MNRDELSVYADELQIQGDIRGEIIALELLARPDLEARRDALVHEWLGFDPRGWKNVRFRFGFVELRASELERVLATPAGPFVRSVFAGGSNTEIVAALGLLASAPRPHLTRLSIVTGRRFEARASPRASFVVTPELARALANATPSLEYLEVVGNRVVEAFPHPSVQRLRVVGHDAIDALVSAGPALPAARELFYAFTASSYGRVLFTDRGLPPTLLARSTLPALELLDVSANELQRSWDNNHVAVFELLSEFGVTPHLRHLRVPALVRDEDHEAIAHVRALTRANIEPTNDRPQPLHDAIDEGTILGVTLQGHDHEHRLSLRRLGEFMSAGWATFDEDTRDAWRALWQIVTTMPRVPDDFYEYRELPVEVFALPVLAIPIASVGDAIDDDFGWSELAAVVARARAERVFARRYAY